MAYALITSFERFFILLLVMLFISFPTMAENKALVIRGDNQVFEEIVKGIEDDLAGDLTLVDMLVNKNTSPQHLSEMFAKYSPRLIILIGNKAVNLYAAFQATDPQQTFPPAIALAALFIDKFVENIQNITAIRYEIPAVTSAVALRSLLSKPLKKIGVVYQEWMEDVIVENRRYCLAEGFELIGIKLSNDSNNISKEIERALKKLNKEVDAIWIVNDNHLLTQETLRRVWLPHSSYSRLPAIVGIKQFITKVPLGAFAIVPDNYDLGVQAANIIVDIIESDWVIAHKEIHQPLSIKKFVNIKTLDSKTISYHSLILNQLDEVISQ